MGIRSGISTSTPERIIIDAGAVYLNYGLSDQRLLGATRGGNEFNLNRVLKAIEVDGPKGGVKGLKRVTEVNPQITANLIELSVENLITAIAGGNQSDLGFIGNEYVGVGDTATVQFDVNQNDVVKNSERVYLSNAAGVLTLLARSAVYPTHFVGTHFANNKEFESGVGNWDSPASGDVHSVDVSGQSGNCMKFLAGATSAALFMKLDGASGAVLTNLTVGYRYRFQFAIKKATWGTGGIVTVTCDAGSVAATLTTSYVIYVVEFVATGTDATIKFTGAGVPDDGDSCFIDHLDLYRVDGQYTMNWNDNVNAKACIIFPANDIPTADERIIVSYTYELAAAGDHTIITGGEIADTDYITNVAIVGNVSGKTYPVICIVKNVLADAGFALSMAPRDEAVPSIVFTGHYTTDDLDSEPWEVRWPNS